jgi:uncharacterized membrane protein
MAIHELRPMSTGEILDAVFGIYRTAFVVMVSIVIICQGIPTILYTYVLVAGGPFVQVELFLASLFLRGIGATLSGAAIIVVVSDTLLGKAPDTGTSLRMALRAFVALFVAGLARLLLVGLGFLLFVVPSVIIVCGYLMVEQVIMLEQPKRAINALPRSWALTKGYKGKLFGLVVILLLFVQLIPSMAAGALVALLPAFEAHFQIGVSLLQLVLFPLLPVAFTLAYYDLRVRKEAFDLEFLSAQIGIDSDPVPV